MKNCWPKREIGTEARNPIWSQVPAGRTPESLGRRRDTLEVSSGMSGSDGRASSVEQFFQFSLLGMLVSGYCALVGSGALDLPALVFTGGGLLLRLLLLLGLVRFQLNPRMVAAATLGYIGFYPLDVLYVSREFVPATVHLICFLAVVRIFSAQTDRDYFFVKVIAFLELLAATILSGSVNFFLFLTLFVIFGIATFCSSEIRRSNKMPNQVVLTAGGPVLFGRSLGALALIVTVGTIGMTGGFFILLPRTAHAALRSVVPDRYHLPGFSNEVTLGQIGELKQSTTPVMHVRLAPPDERLSLKWRGAALTQFDGRRWYNPPGRVERIPLSESMTALMADEDRRNFSRSLSYEVRIAAVDSDALFFAGTPAYLLIDDLRYIYRGIGDSYRTGFGTADGRSYKAIGLQAAPLHADSATGVKPLPPTSYYELLLLPASTDKRIIELARETGQGFTPVDRARSIEHYLQTRLSYTTELPAEKSADPLATFLFERRKGHCEYFASAMAVMLRVIHIPSRVVTGFQSGTFNPLTGWHVIRASDAHSWVEAWIPGRGWTTFDPTPPDLRGSRETAPLLSKLLLYYDAADTLWQDWVINYSLDHQLDLAARVQQRTRLVNSEFNFGDEIRDAAKRTGNMLKPWLTYAAGAFLLLLACVFLGPFLWDHLKWRKHAATVSRRNASASDAAILYNRMLRTLRRRGLDKPAWLTPAEFARIVPEPRQAQLVQQITAAYHELRYAHRPEAGPVLVQLLQELESIK